MILDGETLGLVNAVDRLLEDSETGEIKPELLQSVLEISTSPVRDVREAGVAAARAAPAGARHRPAPRPDDRLGGDPSVRAVGGPARRRPPALPRARRRRCASSRAGDHLRAARPRRPRRPRQGHPRRQRDARAPPGAARAGRQLAVLARRQHGPGLGPHADLPRLPARRRAARVRGLGRLRAADRLHGRLRRDRGLHVALVRRAPAPRTSARSRSAPWTGRRAWSTRSPSPRSCRRWSRSSPSTSRPASRSPTSRGRCSTRTSGSRRATASTASSSTCRRASACRRAPSRGASTTACASTPRTSDRPTSSPGSPTSWTRQRRRAAGPGLRGEPGLRRGSARDRGGHRRLTDEPVATGALGCVESFGHHGSGPDLFVVCKSCGSEVVPYITECPYCGTRLRKRAPKLERGGVPKPREGASARARGSGGCAPARSPGSAATGARTSRSRSSLAAVIVTLRARAGYGTSRGSSSAARSATTGGGRSRRCSSTTADGLRGRRARRDLPVRLAARAPPRLVGAAAGLLRSAALARHVAGRRARSRRARARRRTTPRSRCSPPGRCATCSRRRRGEEIDGDLLGVAAIAIVLALLPVAAAGGAPARRARRRRSSGSRSACCSPACPSARRRAPCPARRPRAGRSPAVDPGLRARGHRREQAAGGHRVAHEPAPRPRARPAPTSSHVSASARLRREPPASARSSASSSSTPSIAGHGRGVDLRGQPARRRQLVQVAEQAEPRDVGERVRARPRAPARPRGR